MLNFKLMFTGQLLMNRELRDTVYELTPRRHLLGKNVEGWETEAEVMRAIRRAFLLPPDGDPETRCKSVFDMTDKRTLRQMEVDRWVEGGGSFLQHDSAAGFLLVRYDTSKKTLPLSQAEVETQQSLLFVSDFLRAGGIDSRRTDEQRKSLERPDPLGTIWLDLVWSQMGAVSCLCHAAEAGGKVAMWQSKVENALRDTGFAIGTFRDSLA